MSLSDKQRRFVHEYLIDMNGAQAAIRAGYSPKAAKEQAARLLTKANVAQAVAEGMEQKAAELGIDARWVLQEAVSVYREARQEGDRSAALKSLDLVGKHVDVAAFKERVEHTGKDGGPIDVRNLSNLTDAQLEALALIDVGNPD